MVKKKPGKINEIIYNNTVYHQGKYTISPTLNAFEYIAKQVIDAGETTRMLTVIPFYVNYKRNGQVEFEEMVFHIECKEGVTEEEQKNFIKECGNDGDDFNELSKRFYLCDSKNINYFCYAIQTYIDYLEILIPKMVKILKTEYKLTDEELMFGHFQFSLTNE